MFDILCKNFDKAQNGGIFQKLGISDRPINIINNNNTNINVYLCDYQDPNYNYKLGPQPDEQPLPLNNQLREQMNN